MSKPSWWQVIKSVLAAFMGIQSKSNREHDFTKGNVVSYIVVGIAATIVFILTLVFIIKLIIGS